MAKIIQYEIRSGEEVLPVELRCLTQEAYDANYPVAQKEAVGEITVEGEFETAAPTDAERIKELEEALDLLLSGVTE